MRRILSLIILSLIFALPKVNASEKTVSVTTYYPSPIGDYDTVRTNSTVNYNTISNPVSFEINSIADFNFVNINKGVRVFSEIVGDFENSVSMADAANLGSIEFDAATQNILIKGIQAKPVKVIFDQEGSAMYEQSGVVIKRDGSEKRFIGLLSGTNNNLVFNRDGSISDMVIDESGNLGLGTDTPLSAIHIKSDADPKFIITDKDASSAGVAVNDNSVIVAAENGNINMGVTVAADGKVGVGLQSPQALLHLEADDPDIVMESSASVSGYNTVFLRHEGVEKWMVGKTSSNDFFIPRHDGNAWQNGTFFIDYDTGNVGIGTTTPIVSFDVNGILSTVNPGTSISGSYIDLSSPYRNPGFAMLRGNGSGTPVQRWDIQVPSDEDYKFIDVTSGAGSVLVLQDSTGNVGIGKNNPKEKLDLVGSMKQTGSKGIIEFGAEDNSGVGFNIGLAGVRRPLEVFSIRAVDNSTEHYNLIANNKYYNRTTRINGGGRLVVDGPLEITSGGGSSSVNELFYVMRMDFNANKNGFIYSSTFRWPAGYDVPFVCYYEGCEAVVPDMRGKSLFPSWGTEGEYIIDDRGNTYDKPFKFTMNNRRFIIINPRGRGYFVVIFPKRDVFDMETRNPMIF